MNAEAKALRERLEGALIAAVPVPFDAEGNYKAEAEEQLVRYHAGAKTHGVAVWVHTGRGLCLGAKRRAEVAARWRRGLRPEQMLIAGVGCPNPEGGGPENVTDDAFIAGAVGMAEEAKTFGADGILVYAPVRFRGRDDQDDRALEYHQAIAEVGLPTILFYLYEAAGGISYGLTLLERLLAIRGVAGIKVATLDSVMTYQDIAGLAREKAPEAALLTGEDRFYGYTILRGATGALIGMGSVAPDPQVEIMEAWRAGNFERFTKLSGAIDRFAETTFIRPMEGYIRRILLALSAEGVIPREATFDPWGPEIGKDEAEPIAAALRALNEV